MIIIKRVNHSIANLFNLQTCELITQMMVKIVCILMVIGGAHLEFIEYNKNIQYTVVTELLFIAFISSLYFILSLLVALHMYIHKKPISQCRNYIERFIGYVELFYITMIVCGSFALSLVTHIALYKKRTDHTAHLSYDQFLQLLYYTAT